jgi:hypothetical protein
MNIIQAERNLAARGHYLRHCPDLKRRVKEVTRLLTQVQQNPNSISVGVIHSPRNEPRRRRRRRRQASDSSAFSPPLSPVPQANRTRFNQRRLSSPGVPDTFNNQFISDEERLYRQLVAEELIPVSKPTMIDDFKAGIWIPTAQDFQLKQVSIINCRICEYLFIIHVLCIFRKHSANAVIELRLLDFR